MRKLEKFFLGLVFSILFSLFVLLTTANLLLNDKYIFYVLDKHQVYNQIPTTLASSFVNDPNLSVEERLGYWSILSNVDPLTIKSIVEKNVKEFLNFIHGKSSTIEIFLPTKELGLGSGDLKWSPNQELMASLESIKGIGTKLIFLWIILLVILIGIYTLYGKVNNSKLLLGGRRLLVTTGILLTIEGVFLTLLLPALADSFPKNLEPSQALIKILFSSIIPEIGLIWLILGLGIFSVGILFVYLDRKLTKL